MWKKVLLVLVILLALFAGFVALQPAEFAITRSARMDAPPETIFAEVNDLHRWEAWSPWAKLDPDAKNSFSGAEAGEGARFTWSGNDQVGEGTMTIVESVPPERVEIEIEFRRPMVATNHTLIALAPDGEATQVTWTMSGENGFMGKLFGLLMDVDGMVGADFERGLASLRQIVETQEGPETGKESE